MSKLTKLIKNPFLFFKDFLEKRTRKDFDILNEVEESQGKDLIFAFHINDWKRNFLSDFFINKKIIFVPFFVDKKVADRKKWINIINSNPLAEVLIWGMNAPSFINDLKNNKIYMEDGFIRSVGLGASHTLPFSLTLDRSTPYFDSTKQSDMERILSTYDFLGEPELLIRSKKIIDRIVETGISKYNNSSSGDINSFYGVKSKKRILVIGQVEDDASIKYGSIKKYTNNDLVNIARMENPGAEIFYKPHPDVLARKRKELSNPQDVAHLCNLLVEDIPLSQAFKTIDHVYTITSQAGFEALMRGIKVTTVGAPFYSGWGLTDDRQITPRRERKLSLEEVFAAAYILYPVYFNPFIKERIQIEEAIEQLIEMRALNFQSIKENIDSNKELLIDQEQEDFISRDEAIKIALSAVKSNIKQIELLLK